MATKREIEIAKKIYAWPMDYDELPLNTIAPLEKLIDSIPHDLEAERKAFEEHMCIEYSPPEEDYKREVDGRYVRSYFEDHWITWKAARGIE